MATFALSQSQALNTSWGAFLKSTQERIQKLTTLSWASCETDTIQFYASPEQLGLLILGQNISLQLDPTTQLDNGVVIFSDGEGCYRARGFEDVFEDNLPEDLYSFAEILNYYSISFKRIKRA